MTIATAPAPAPRQSEIQLPTGEQKSIRTLRVKRPQRVELKGQPKPEGDGKNVPVATPNSRDFFYPQSKAPELSTLYALRYQIYCLERQFLCPSAYPDGLETDAEDPRSTHFVTRNGQNDVVGTVRLVLSEEGQLFPFEEHCSTYDEFTPPKAQLAAEISRLAVDKHACRRSGVSADADNDSSTEMSRAASRTRGLSPSQTVLNLYREMYRYSVAHGIRYWYAAMEKSLMRMLARYGVVFEPIGEEQSYYGPVRPYLADLTKVEKQIEIADPKLYWWFRHAP